MAVKSSQQEIIARMLIQDEGVRYLPYRDSVGVLTVGVGHNLNKGISQNAALYILTEDIDEATNECYRVFGRQTFKAFPEHVQNAVICMMFNLGASRFLEFKKMIKALRAGNYTEAAEHALDSQWAKQVKSRSARLACLMKEGFYSPVYGTDLSDCD